jgi:hypothetical protein
MPGVTPKVVGLRAMASYSSATIKSRHKVILKYTFIHLMDVESCLVIWILIITLPLRYFLPK